MRVFYVLGAVMVAWAWNTDSRLMMGPWQQQFVELSEFNPLIEIGRATKRVVPRGWGREEKRIV